MEVRKRTIAILMFIAVFLGIAASTVRGQANPSPKSADLTKTNPHDEGPSNPPVAIIKPKPALSDGLALYRTGDFAEAARNFTAIAESGGESTAAAYAWLARTKLRLGQPEDAEVAAKKALEVNKDSPTAQSAMGEIYFREGKFMEAQDQFRRIYLAKLAEPRAYLGLAQLYWATANNRSAKAMIDVAHQLSPEDPDIQWNWINTLDEKEYLIEIRKWLDTHSKQRTNLPNFATVTSLLEDQEKRPERKCQLVTRVEATETKLNSLLVDNSHLRGYGLTVDFNGTKANLLVDTGSSGILITKKIAEKAGVQPVVDESIHGIGDKGAAQGYVGFAEKITIGELEFQNCYVEVVDQKRSLSEEGLIGPDVFEEFLVDLDFPNQKFRLSSLPPFPDEPTKAPALKLGLTPSAKLHNQFVPPPFAKFQKAYRFGSDLLLLTQVNQVPDKLFLLDTGAWDNTITPSAAREATKLHTNGDIKVKGLSGEVNKVYSANYVTLTFGSFRQEMHEIVAFDLKNISDSLGTEVSGILGFAMLWQLEIKIDYRDQLVDFHYDPNRIRGVTP